MSKQDRIAPNCKWCFEPLPEYKPGHYAGTFDPIDRWSAIERTEEEIAAVEEAESLMDQWRQEYRRTRYYRSPSEYLSRQSERNYLISEMCFQRLLHAPQGGLVCFGCFDRWRGREDTDPVH